jgi:XTP/dITP diphosphohydrolase
MLYFITSNTHKYTEVACMTDTPIEQYFHAYPEIQADTLEEVAEFAIDYCYTVTKTPCFIEDSGLFVAGLSGFPGVYSKYVFTTIGYKGILQLLKDDTERTAHFKSVIAYHDGTKTTLFKGEATGIIADEPKGSHGFGYDPIFIPDGASETFAQMSTEGKNLYSHRGKAFKRFIKYIEQVR